MDPGIIGGGGLFLVSFVCDFVCLCAYMGKQVQKRGREGSELLLEVVDPGIIGGGGLPLACSVYFVYVHLLECAQLMTN